MDFCGLQFHLCIYVLMTVKTRSTAFLLLVALWMMAVGTAAVPDVHAQSADRYDLSVRGEPLAAVLTEVKEKANVDLIYEPSVIGKKRASCTARQLLAPELLRCVLTGTGLRAERLRSGTFAIRLDPSSTTRSMSGFVRDADTGEALPGATVYAMHHGRGTTTNEYGYFSLNVEADTARLAVRFLGYTQRRQDVYTRQSEPVDVSMERSRVELDAVEVTEERDTVPVLMAEPGALSIPVAQLKQTPALLGEPDVFRSLQFAPGVQTGAEGSAGLFVRGGTRGQNLILLDGAPVYNAYHVFGFLSVFSPQSVRNVELRTGAFPARYGGRLASVVSLRLNEGNRRSYDGQASLGLVTASGDVEGPLPGDRGSFMVTARRSVAGDIAHLAAPDDVPFGRFYDVSAKVNLDLNDRNQLYLSVYRSRDAYDNDTRDVNGPEDESGASAPEVVREQVDTFSMGWENTLATLRWNSVHGDRAFSRFMLLASDYRYRTRKDQRIVQDEAILDQSRSSTASGLTDVGSQYDLNLQVSNRYRFRIGGSATLHRYQPGQRDLRVVADQEAVLDTTIAPSGKVSTMEWGAYVENQVDVTSRLSANVGMRVSGLIVQGRTRAHFEPRFHTSLQLTDRVQWTTSYARMAQYVHQLSNSGVGLPTDLWVPATREVGNQSSHQISTGVAASFGNTVARVEGYSKWMDGLLEYRPGASYVSGQDWQTLVTQGSGRSRGIELSVQKPAGRLTGQMSYTLSKSTRTFPRLNGGRTFPFQYDHRHNFGVMAAYAFSEKWTGSASWVYRSGSAITLPTQQSLTESAYILYEERQPPIQTVQEYGERNGFRMPASHRLDLSVQRIISTSWGQHEIQAGLYNAYNRKNPFFVFLDTERELIDPDECCAVRLRRVGKIVTLIPRIPSLRYTVSF